MCKRLVVALATAATVVCLGATATYAADLAKELGSLWIENQRPSTACWRS